MARSKILLLDIETAPALVYAWGVYDQNIPINHIVHYPYLMCWSAKWLGDSAMMSDALINHPTEFRRNPRSDKEICESIWGLLNECDVAIAHNGDDFDLKRLNTYFVKNGMKSPKPFSTVDTKKVARGNFGFISNKLDSLCRELSIGSKLQHSGMKLWTDCMEGDPQAWKTMVKYNKQDVRLLEELYLTLRPFIKNHPHIGLLSHMSKYSCPNCGAKDSIRNGYRTTRQGRYERRQCKKCASWFIGELIERVKNV